MRRGAVSRPRGVAGAEELGARQRAAHPTEQALADRSRVAAVPEVAPFFAELAVGARRLAEPEALVAWAAARRLEEPAALDAVVLRREAAHAAAAPEVARDAAEGPRQEEVEAPDAAAALRPGAAERGAVAGPQPAEEAARVEGEEEVLRPAAPGAQAAALPSAALSAFHQDQDPPWPAPAASALFARAMARLRIASP